MSPTTSRPSSASWPSASTSSQTASSRQLIHGLWAVTRREALLHATQLVEHARQDSRARHRPLVLLLDDTMHLRSMRKKVYQLAVQLDCSYAQVLLDCALQVALERDNARHPEQRVGSDVLVRMQGRFESFDTSHGWETFSLVLTSDDCSMGQARHKVLALIERALCVRAPQLCGAARTSQGKTTPALDRVLNASSLAHQLDLHLRRLISERMKRQPTDPTQPQAQARTDLILRLSRAKKRLLATTPPHREGQSMAEYLAQCTRSFDELLLCDAKRSISSSS